MDTLPLVALISAAALGIVATIGIMRRQRRETAHRESPFAVSTEGETRCPSCGMGNLWTESQCASCGARLAG
jgi:hypothetical protein